MIDVTGRMVGKRPCLIFHRRRSDSRIAGVFIGFRDIKI